VFDNIGRFPRTKLSTSLVDSHVYVCKRSVLDLLHAKTQFSSLREEFLPWLCEIQYQRSKRIKYGNCSWLAFVKQLVLTIHLVVAVDATTKSSSQILSLQHSSLLGQNLKKSDDDHDPNDVASSTVSDIGYGDHASLKVGIVIHERSDYAMRINTLQNFYEVNKRVRNCLSMAGY